MKRYVLSLDQGTTSSRAILFDHDRRTVAVAQKEYRQFYPQAGYVEQDPLEIFSSQYAVMNEVIAQSGISVQKIAAIGITNQRETTIVWEKATGKPIYHAIVWQCRRTAPLCEQLVADGWTDYIREHTGLVPDAYFSGTKLRWILDAVPGAQQRAERGELLFGTVDSWLLWKLTEGAVHTTDYTNASRTMLYDIRRRCWDETLCNHLSIPMAMLPTVKTSSEIYGTVNLSGVKIPIAGMAGDQQAALFGHRCIAAGQVKNTYGTGCFMLMNVGQDYKISEHGLLTTLAASTDHQPPFVLEGSVFTGGSILQWLRDELGLISTAAESEARAAAVPDTNGVVVVPALTGLGAPYWDMYARGAILGLTRGANANHIIRAALESIAHQSKDLLDAMQADWGQTISRLEVDGGAARNSFLMQFQADLLGIEVVRPTEAEMTALGAAMLAGLAVGFWNETELKTDADATVFSPSWDEAKRQTAVAQWKTAVGRVLSDNERLTEGER